MSYPNNPPVPASITVDTTASINSGLVGFWPLTNQSGTTTSDLSTGGNDGTLVGSITWENGEKGYASEHPSAGATYISTGYSAAGESAITVSAWVRNDGGAVGNSFGKIVSQSHSGNFDSYMNKSSNAALSFDINTTVVSANNADIPAIGTWFHVCLVWEQSVYQGVYINGVESNTTTADTSVIGALTHNLFIGGSSAITRPWDGGIQNVRIYNRALTATEVAELYSVPWTGTDYVAQNLTPDTPLAMGVDPNHSLSSGLVGYWPLSDGSGSSPGDISGNSETLTNGGSSAWATKEVGAVAVVNGNTGKYYSTDSSFSTMIGGSTPATDPWSISLWASLFLIAPYEYEAGFLSIGSSSADGTPFLIAQRRGGTDVSVYWGGAYTSTTSVSHQVWTNIVIVFDGTTMNYYTNGSLAGSRTSSGTNGSTSEKLWIGTGYNNVAARTDDHIQNVRVYNRALSATEVEDLYNEPWAGVVTAKSAPPQYLTVDTADSINTGLQGFWPLSDGSGSTAVDLSANGNDFTNTGGVTWGATDKGTAADFNGTNGTYIRGGTSLLASPSAITVSAWVKLDTYNSSTGHGIVSRWGSGSSGNQFLLYYPSAGTGPRFFVTNSGTNYIAQSSTSSTGFTGRYVHFVGTWDGTDVKLYIDGTEDATTTGPASINSGNSDYIEIGNYVANTFCMDGNIQNVRIYDRALSAAEVSRLYQDPWAGTDRAIEPSPTVKDLDTSSTLTTNLVGWWPLTEFGPQDTLAYDISGNGNHGVANGGVQRQFTDLVRSATFDGVDDYFDTTFNPRNKIGNGNDWSVSLWLRQPSAKNNARVFGNHLTNRFYVATSTSVLFWGFGSQFTTSTGVIIPFGQWFHATFTYDSTASEVRSYKNGALTVTTSYTGDGVFADVDCQIGDILHSSIPFQGEISNLRVYNRALSAAEVQTLYDDPWVGLATDSLVYAYYSAAFLQRLG